MIMECVEAIIDTIERTIYHIAKHDIVHRPVCTHHGLVGIYFSIGDTPLVLLDATPRLKYDVCMLRIVDQDGFL